MTFYRLDDHGEPVACRDVLEWAIWFETADRAVAQDRIGRVYVSTVFLGLEYPEFGGGSTLFETMIFGGPLDGSCERYRTRREALAGHARLVAAVRQTHQDDPHDDDPDGAAP